MTEQEKQVCEQSKKTLELFSIYEYLFGAINNYNALKKKVITMQPVKIPISNFDFLSENPELLKKAVERFVSIGISIRLEDDGCIIG